MIELRDAALLADSSYNQINRPAAPGGWIAVRDSVQLENGFTGNAFYNAGSNTLVIGFGGTDGTADLGADESMAVFGSSSQEGSAVWYADGLVRAFDQEFGPGTYNLVFVGHSLGGALAQRALLAFPGSTATVFNSPGLGGFSGEDLQSDDIVYYYSNPNSWSLGSGEGLFGALVMAGDVHVLGDLLNSNVHIFTGAEGHPMGSILAAINRGEQPISMELWAALLADMVLSGDISQQEFLNWTYFGWDMIEEDVVDALDARGFRLMDKGPAWEAPEFNVIARHDNGGIAALATASGLLVTTHEDSRYTEAMLSTYGTIRVNSDGSLEAVTTLGATLRMFGDWLGLDGTWGLDGGFAHEDEGLEIVGQPGADASGADLASDNDRDNDDGRDDRVVVFYGGTPDPDKVVITDGGMKKKPILLDLDGDGVEITELDRSTVYMDADGTGQKNRTAWAGQGDGVLFYDADGSNSINDNREYIFTEWDPTARDDLSALRSRFDGNGDGKLTGAELGGFKVMVTGANGALTVQTAAALGSG